MLERIHIGPGLILLVCGWMPCARAQDPDADADPLQRYAWIGPVSDVEHRIGGILRESRHADDATRGHLLEQLTALGRPAIPGFFETLAQERVPPASDGDKPQCLSSPQRDLLLAAVSTFPPQTLRELANDAPSLSAVEGWNVSHVRILGAVGDETDLRTLAGILPRSAEHELDSSSRLVLQQAYASILRRTPRAYSEVEKLCAELHSDAAGALLKALADVGDGRALPVFLAAARSRAELSRTAVALVPKLSPCADVAVSLEFAAWLRDQVDLLHPEQTRAVFQALAALDEGAAFPTLFDSLDGEVPVRESALAALQRISGMAFGADRRRWEAWYREELGWFDRTRAQRASKQRPPSGYEIVQLLRDYSQHRLFKSELALDLVPLTENPDPAIRALACRTIEGLRSPAPVRDLVPLLDDPVPSVSLAAQHAIATLTGKQMSSNSAGLVAGQH